MRKSYSSSEVELNTARSRRSVSDARREKLTALLHEQNSKPRSAASLMPSHHAQNSSRYGKNMRSCGRQVLAMKSNMASSRQRRRGGPVGGTSGFGGARKGDHRMRDIQLSKIAEHESIENGNPSLQIVVPEPIFFNGLNAIERPQWSLMENFKPSCFGISFWIRPSPTLATKETTRASKLKMQRHLIGSNDSQPKKILVEKGIDMSSSEWRVVACRRGARSIDSIMRMQEYGDGANEAYGNQSHEVAPGELCTPMLQLSAKTCQLQLYAWTNLSSTKPAGRLVTKGICPYGQWTHVTLAMENKTAKIFLNGQLDAHASFEHNLFLPEASLLIGRGTCFKKNGGMGNHGYAPSVASSNSSRMSTASFVNGGDHRSNLSTVGNGVDDDPEGFVGFMSHVTIHAKLIEKKELMLMIRPGERPGEPVERDEWSMLVKVNKRLQDDQERKKRIQRDLVKLEQKHVLDDQVAYNAKKKEELLRAERQADLVHLSQFNANGDQLLKEIAREKREKVAKNRASMSEQRRIEQLKKDIQEKEEMMREREDMMVLKRQVEAEEAHQREIKAKKRNSAKAMMDSYKVLLEEKAAKEAEIAKMARRDRESAERDARNTLAMETARKRKKAHDQISYRQCLAEQMQIKNGQRATKYHMSEEERTINRQYLQEIIDDGGGLMSGRSNWEGSQYSYAPQTQRSGAFSQKIGGKEHGATMSKRKLAEIKKMLNS